MSLCSNSNWRITLTLDRTSEEETFTFVLRFDHSGQIVGDKVIDSLGEEYPILSGTCHQSDELDIGTMTIIFNLRGVRIRMIGVAFDIGSGFEVMGVFVAPLDGHGVRTSEETPASADLVARISPEPGDTGTGGGSQSPAILEPAEVHRP